MDKLIVTSLGIIGIAFTYWFFLYKKNEEVNVKDNVEIIVDGGYKPNIIRIQKGKRFTISFLRKDQNSCLEEIVIPDFKIKKILPLGEKVSIQIRPESKGTIPFSCGMNMFHGKIIVV